MNFCEFIENIGQKWSTNEFEVYLSQKWSKKFKNWHGNIFLSHKYMIKNLNDFYKVAQYIVHKWTQVSHSFPQLKTNFEI
jgi:hypothetical protein